MGTVARKMSRETGVNIVLFALVLVVGGMYFTAEVNPARKQNSLDQVKRIFEENTGGKLKVKRAGASPVPDLIELELDGGAVGYVDKTGQYVLIAPMIDTKGQRIASNFVNLGAVKPGANVEAQTAGANVGTEQGIKAVGGVAQTGFSAPVSADTRVEISGLTGGIKWANGSGSKRLVVFSDPHCPYCKQLDQVLRDANALPDTTIEIFPYPLRNQHPRAAQVSASVWCQPESQRANAWQAAVNGVDPPEVPVASLDACNKKVEAVERIGEAWGVVATPTMFAPNGARLSGAATAAEITQFINANLK